MDNKRVLDAKQINGDVDSDGDHSDNLNGDKTKRKRRSKNDAEGRSFKCPDCGKSYLSQPALTNHKKTKHAYGANGEKKGRGRPRKNPPIMASNDTSEKKFRQFFENAIRKPTEEKIDVDFAKESFKDIFIKYNKVFDNIANHEDHPFYKTQLNIWDESACNTNGTPQNLENPALNANNTANPATIKPRTDITCDEIFGNYLRDVASKTNKDYFHFIFKFLILFRECINKTKKNEAQPDDQFTTVNNAETVPDTCNEFIVDFMDPNDYYGLDTTELIEAIQHFCYWLYVHNYTTSRLTLL